MGHNTNCRTAVFYSYNNSHKFVSFSRTFQVSSAGDNLLTCGTQTQIHSHTLTDTYVHQQIVSGDVLQCPAAVAFVYLAFTRM